MTTRNRACKESSRVVRQRVGSSRGYIFVQLLVKLFGSFFFVRGGACSWLWYALLLRCGVVLKYRTFGV